MISSTVWALWLRIDSLLLDSVVAVVVDLSRWYPAHPIGQASERVEDSRQEDNRPMRCEHASGCHSADWWRARLL